MFSLNKDLWRFFDIDKKMMLEKPLNWENQNSNHEGDALWRTGISYIAYKEPIMKEGILECYRKYNMINKGDKYWYQAMRCTGRYREDDVSRDQTIMSLSALAINGDMDEFKNIVAHLPYTLSRRFKMTPGMWLWLKAVATKKKFYVILFGIFLTIEHLVSTILTKFVSRILKVNKEYSADEMMNVDDSTGFWFKRDNVKWVWLTDKGVSDCKKMHGAYKKKLDENKFLNFLDMIRHPAYAIHLAAWMVYCIPDGFWKKTLNKIIWWSTEKQNLLIKKLVGKTVTQEEIEAWKPTYGFRWSSRWDGTGYADLLEGEDAIYNVIDKDILLAL